MIAGMGVALQVLVRDVLIADGRQADGTAIDRVEGTGPGAPVFLDTGTGTNTVQVSPTNKKLKEILKPDQWDKYEKMQAELKQKAAEKKGADKQ